MDLPLSAVNYQAALDLKTAIAGADGSTNTKRNVIRLIKPAYDRAVKLYPRLIKQDPFDLFDRSEKPKKSQSRIEWFTTDQMPR